MGESSFSGESAPWRILTSDKDRRRTGKVQLRLPARLRSGAEAVESERSDCSGKPLRLPKAGVMSS